MSYNIIDLGHSIILQNWTYSSQPDPTVDTVDQTGKQSAIVLNSRFIVVQFSDFMCM